MLHIYTIVKGSWALLPCMRAAIYPTAVLNCIATSSADEILVFAEAKKINAGIN